MQLETPTQSIVQNEGAAKENGILVGIHFAPYSCWKGTWNNLHYHNEYIEILYAKKGRFSVMLNGVVYDIAPGSVFVINSGELHATRSHQPDDPEAELMCLRFMPEVLYTSKQNILEFEYNITQIFDFLGNIRYLSPDIVENSYLPVEFNYLKQEEETRNFGYALNIRSSTLRIFAWIIRYWHQNTIIDTSQMKISTTNLLILMKTYVEENYQTATLRSAAKALNLSYSYFSRLFNSYIEKFLRWRTRCLPSSPKSEKRVPSLPNALFCFHTARLKRPSSCFARRAWKNWILCVKPWCRTF